VSNFLLQKPNFSSPSKPNDLLCMGLLNTELATTFSIFWGFHNLCATLNHMYYEKLCPRKLDWHANRSSWKLLCNKGTTTLRKYDELIIKMSCQNIS
jgi:hypothetical protein